MKKFLTTLAAMAMPLLTFASEANLKMPESWGEAPEKKILYYIHLLQSLPGLISFHLIHVLLLSLQERLQHGSSSSCLNCFEF